MKKARFSLFYCLVSLSFGMVAGCGGGADNTVSAPPETVQTQEELDSQMKDYETRMREEEAKRSASN